VHVRKTAATVWVNGDRLASRGVHLMEKVASTRTSSVCVFSAHPLVLQQFQKLLGALSVSIRGELYDAPLVSDCTTTAVPEAQIYVVDSNAVRSIEPLITAIFERRPEAQVLVVGDGFNQESYFRYLQLGAKGLLSYADAELQLARAVRSVAAGGYWVPRQILARFVDSILKARNGPQLRTNSVSNREREVLEGLLDNLSNKEIAVKLNISERTVKFHVSNLLSKFGVQRRADLILLWFQNANKPLAAEESDKLHRVVM